MPDVNAAFAEWLVSRFMERSRAASIVGDLLEVTAKQGSHAFWFSIAGVLLSLAWRHLAGFAAALLCLYLFHALAMPPHQPEQGLLVAAMRKPHSIQWISISLASLSVYLMMTAPYAVICYGFRDRFAQLTAAFLVPFTVIYFLWSIPAVAVSGIVLAAAILIFSLSSAAGRRGLLALAIVVAIGAAGLRLTVFFAERFLELAPPSVPLTVAVGDSIPFFVVLTATIACAWTHHLLLRPKEEPANTAAVAQNP